MKKMILLPLLASGLMAACSSSSDSKKNGGSGSGGDGSQGPITEQSLTENKWCTIAFEKMEGFGEHTFQVHYRVAFAAEGFLKLQRFTNEGGMQTKEQKQVTCHQDGDSRLSCNDIGKLDYELNGERLYMYTYDDKGQRHPVIENGGSFTSCSKFENEAFDKMKWN